MSTFLTEETTQVTDAAVSTRLSSLDALESEAIHIIREVVAEFEHPVMLFSGGKDSVLMLYLARKAFAPAPVPFPIMHVDTGHNFPEVIEFRDRTVAELGLRLEVASVQEQIDAGRIKVGHPLESRNRHQTVSLLEGIKEGGFDAVFGGGRRDEDKARAKERVLSFRDRFGQWDPKNQRPELWRLYNGRHRKGEHIRVFPISDWTELDVWRYLAREQVDLPPIYFAHEREVVEVEGLLMAVNEFFPLPDGLEPSRQMVRYRTVGDATSTGAVESTATDYEGVIAETAVSRITERGATRALYSDHSSGRWLRGSHWPNSSRNENTRSLARAFASSRRPPPNRASKPCFSAASSSTGVWIRLRDPLGSSRTRPRSMASGTDAMTSLRPSFSIQRSR